MRSKTNVLTVSFTLALLSTALLGVYLPQSQTTTWVAGPDLTSSRTGAAVVLLDDGRLFVCGGADANGPSASSEVLTGNSFAPADSMDIARRDHACVKLPSGLVLAIGGTTADGSATATAEIYDPATDIWSPLGALAQPRTRATALVLRDGRVLVAGGEDAGQPTSSLLSSIELLDPATGAFSVSSAQVFPARRDLAAALLGDGRVLIVGGSDGTFILASTLIYDPVRDLISAGPNLSVPRAGCSATQLEDGSVLVAGGTDGAGELSSAEFYDAAGGVFVPAPGGLATARRGALACLLPGNGSVLFVGGTSGGVDLTYAERFLPWSGQFASAGSLSQPRPGAAGCALAAQGRFLAVGGGLSSSEAYDFAWVRTDKDDYLPDETAEITGSGFPAGMPVTLQVVHITGACGCGEGHDPFTAMADASGRVAADWYVDPDDSLGALFRLTADATDGQHAEWVFSDSPKVGSTVVGAQSPDPVVPGSSATFTVTVNRGSGSGSSGNFTATMSITTALPAGVGASFSPNPVSFTSSQSSRTTTLTLTTTGATPLGASSFTARAATSANDFADGTGTLTLRADQTINFPSIGNRSYGSAPFGLSATASSGLPVSFSLLSGPATISGSTLTITGAGSVTVRASQAGNASFSPAPSVDQTFSVLSAPLAVTPATASRLYGAANPAFSGAIVGIQNGDNITASYSSVATPASPVGGFPITASLSDPNGKLGNYVVTLNTGTLTVNPASLSVTPANASRLYGQSNPAFSGSIVGIQNGDNITASYSSVATPASPVGGFPITATLSDPDGKLGNYVVTLNAGTLTVNPAPLTVTPANASRLYGQSNPAFSGSIVGIQNGDNITASYSSIATPASSIGNFPITASLNDPDSKLGNYVVSLNTGTLTVNPASLSVTPADAARLYGQSNPAFSGSVVGIENGDNITASFSSTATPASPIGGFPITASLSDPDGKLGNYVVTLNTGTMTVNPASLSVTPADAARLYGQSNPAFSGSVVGIENGDNITASFSSVAAPASPIGGFPITASLSDPDGKLGNYVVTLNAGTLTVNPASLSVTPANAARLYGQPNPAFSGSIVGLQNGDNITASYSSTATPASPIGSYPITASLNDPDGKLGNYVLAVGANTGTLTVNPSPLSVTPANASRLYGQSNPAFSGSITGLQNGDPITASFSSAAGPASPIGGYPISASFSDPSSKLGNYIVTLNTGTLTVNQAPLSVTPANASRLYGQPNPAFSGSIVGIQNGDNITASYSSTAIPASPVGSYPITATLNDPAGKLGNYLVTSNTGTLTVGKASLTVRADDKSKVLGAANPTLTGTITGLQGGDNITATYSTSAATSCPVGCYPIVPALVDPDGRCSNYTMTVINGTLTVRYAPAGTTCMGSGSHVILQPINPDGTSVCKWKSSVPAKFRVCDAAGHSIGTPGVVTSFNLVQIVSGTASQDVNEPVDSTNTSSVFQFDPTDQQWIFVINTKPLAANKTYTYQIGLNDGTSIQFSFGLK